MQGKEVRSPACLLLPAIYDLVSVPEKSKKENRMKFYTVVFMSTSFFVLKFCSVILTY